MRIAIEAELVDKKDGMVTLKLRTGFGNPEVKVSADRVQFHDDDAPLPAADDETRLPIILAREMTKFMKGSGVKRNDWLIMGPKETLRHVQDCFDLLRDSLRLHPEKVLNNAVALALAALAVADKADKLEPPTAQELSLHEVE